MALESLRRLCERVARGVDPAHSTFCQCGPAVSPVHVADERDIDVLGTHGLAAVGVGAATERFTVHRLDHGFYPSMLLGLSLWQRRQVGHLCCGEQ